MNAAGVDYGAVPRDMLLKINMLGTHYVLEAFLPYLDNSNVVNYSSVTGYFYQPKKEEMELWMNPDADDFIEKVSEIIPVPTDPRMVALGPDYTAYADLIKHLLTPGHEYLTGCDIIMDGGRTALGMYPQFK